MIQSERNKGIEIAPTKNFDPTKSPYQQSNGNNDANFFFQNM